MDRFDLVVIGSGPAGQRAAIQGAKMGRRVALVERREVVGGTCINTGTIPSKTMREAVLHLSGFLYQGIYGVNYRVKEKITMADLSFRVQQVIKNEIDVTQAQLFRNGITVLDGSACLRRSAHRASAERERRDGRARADAFIIATGTRPAESPTVPINGRTIILSDQVMQMGELPKTLIVVGGGVIGVEYTCMFAALGVRVVLVEKRPRLLEFADSEIVEALVLPPARSPRDAAAGRGGGAVEALPDGGVVATLKSRKKISGDALLYAVGRQRQRRRAQSGGGRSRGRRARAHQRSTPSIAPRQPHIYRGRRRDRVSEPGVGVDGAGTARRRRCASASPSTRIPRTLSVRDLHDPGDLVHRQDRGAADRRGRAVRESGSRTTARSRAGRSAATRPGG